MLVIRNTHRAVPLNTPSPHRYTESRWSPGGVFDAEHVDVGRVNETTLAAPRAINLSPKVNLNATSSYREAQVRGRVVARSYSRQGWIRTVRPWSGLPSSSFDCVEAMARLP